MTTVTKGATVEMHYRLILDNGFVVDGTDEETIRLEVGAGEILPGLEDLLVGLEPGDHREFAIEAGAMFPLRDNAAVQTMPRSQFPADMPLQKDYIYEFTSPSGDAVPGRIEEVGDESVTVDFNHPLAGQSFTFEVDVVSVSEPQ
ncbi:peptidylprolyl isomerase FKBP-type [Thioalkalivibrio sp. K90mix]|uniref:FKBP-type peptidyl-prolyl cis-trans isomerase n=2 Tax=Thioalkalivibrio TaxID=106633 RepID=UPI000195AB76|nr:FKBP-type peptidyl-prolyl cis-trans isomerase [Thioalkalivibrio sp. K90mix]ADC73043.1 peptidylprolyl isomerase FKBP-type [Thioalkalivibrio sp. K90mix]